MPAQRNAKRRASRSSQQLIAAIETGRTKSTKFLARIALALNRRPGDLDPDWLPVEEQRHAVRPASFGGRDLPVYGSAEGGEGQIIVSPDLGKKTTECPSYCGARYCPDLTQRVLS
jgi:hypothetical protein